MKKFSPQISIFILLITVIFLSKDSSAHSANKVLTTDHFIINYNTDNSSCAIALAGKMESYYNTTASFLEFDQLDKINIFLPGDNNNNFFPEISSAIKSNLFISPSVNFNIIEKDLYYKTFLICLQKIMSNGKSISIIEKNFIDALVQYPLKNNNFIETICTDLVNISQITSIDLKKINQFKDDDQLVIYTLMINFVINNYGKKNLIQSLKDADYYGNFYESLSKLTGESISEISDKFNSFIQKRRSIVNTDSPDKKLFLNNPGDFYIITYSLSSNQQCAILQKNKSKFQLMLKNSDDERIIKLEHSESESIYNELTFIENDKLAIVEILESGSKIHIFDLKNNVFVSGISIPLLFISEISFSNSNSLLFSASSGLFNDIYTVNIDTGNLEILTDSGKNFFPVQQNDKVYFVSGSDKWSINEIDVVSGKINTLFSTDQKISHLNFVNSKTLVFSMTINGFDNVFLLDLQTGNPGRITKDSNSILSPQISGQYLYYFSFYKSRYQLFYSVYDTSLFSKSGIIKN